MLGEAVAFNPSSHNTVTFSHVQCLYEKVRVLCLLMIGIVSLYYIINVLILIVKIISCLIAGSKFPKTVHNAVPTAFNQPHD